MKQPLLLGVSGWHNSGKTILMEALIRTLKGGGLRVAAVKHAPHGFEADRPGTDSARLWEAGADAVAVVGPDELLVRERAPEADLDQALARLPGDCDVILVEGFKGAKLPRVVVQSAGLEQLSEMNAIAVVQADSEGSGVGAPEVATAIRAVLKWIGEQRNFV